MTSVEFWSTWLQAQLGFANHLTLSNVSHTLLEVGAKRKVSDSVRSIL